MEASEWLVFGEFAQDLKGPKRAGQRGSKLAAWSCNLVVLFNLAWKGAEEVSIGRFGEHTSSSTLLETNPNLPNSPSPLNNLNKLRLNFSLKCKTRWRSQTYQDLRKINLFTNLLWFWLWGMTNSQAYLNPFWWVVSTCECVAIVEYSICCRCMQLVSDSKILLYILPNTDKFITLHNNVPGCDLLFSICFHYWHTK